MGESPASDVNRLVLDATLIDREALRYTPGGIPAVSLTLKHASQQPEAGGMRKVECELAAVAFGAQAQSLATCAIGSRLRLEGFVARRWRTGTTLALHIERFESKDHGEGH